MKMLLQNAGPRSRGLAALGVIGVLVLFPPRLVGQTTALAGQGLAASVRTALTAQTFASASLPDPGGCATADADQASVLGVLSAGGLTSMTSGMADVGENTTQTTAEAAGVSIMNGLVQAKQVLAVASSWVTEQGASSSAEGSQLAGLVVAGVNLGDVTPAPNTRMSLPGVGYVVLNEQTRSGDGVTASGMAVNLIHVVLLNVLGIKTGEVIVGSASSHVSR